jgi:hypothetical protein
MFQAGFHPVGWIVGWNADFLYRPLTEVRRNNVNLFIETVRFYIHRAIWTLDFKIEPLTCNYASGGLVLNAIFRFSWADPTTALLTTTDSRSRELGGDAGRAQLWLCVLGVGEKT